MAAQGAYPPRPRRPLAVLRSVAGAGDAEQRPPLLLRSARTDGVGARHDRALVAAPCALRELRRGPPPPPPPPALHHPARPQPDDQPFGIRLARSQRELEVPVGQSILATLRAHGCTAPSSCESGTCGTCRTTLLAGQAQHRDMVLLPEEMSGQIMICVSRAKSPLLVLDL